MASSSAELSAEDLVYGYLAEHLDAELPPNLSASFGTSLQAQGGEALVSRFQGMRGRLQLAIQAFYLREDELQELHALVQDPKEQATLEQEKIDALGRTELLGSLLRRLVLASVVLVVVGGLVWKLAPRTEQRFKPLEYLGYEALALEEEPRERINLPSRDLKEIKQYLANYPGLKFSPKVLQSLGSNWQPVGASVIDYEIAKVAVVIYGRDTGKEKLFHFSYSGTLKDLPKSEQGNMRGLLFQTYASEELNLIAWQAEDGVVSLLIGRRSAPELAELAVMGSGKS